MDPRLSHSDKIINYLKYSWNKCEFNRLEIHWLKNPSTKLLSGHIKLFEKKNQTVYFGFDKSNLIRWCHVNYMQSMIRTYSRSIVLFFQEYSSSPTWRCCCLVASPLSSSRSRSANIWAKVVSLRGRYHQSAKVTMGCLQSCLRLLRVWKQICINIHIASDIFTAFYFKFAVIAWPHH